MSRYRKCFVVPPFAKSAFSKESLFLAYHSTRHGFANGLVYSDDDTSPFTLFNCSEPTGRDLNAICCSPLELLSKYQQELSKSKAEWVTGVVELYLQKRETSLREALIAEFTNTFGSPP